jgi:CMP-N-acetylneuraminic acid synthetase
MKSVAAVTGVRRNSQRVPSKNFRPFAGSTLFEIKLRQLLQVQGVDRVYVSSNDREALAIAESLGVTPLVRPDELCTEDAGISQFAPHFARQITEDAVLYTLVTCPLIEPATYARAIEEFRALDTSRHDSLCSFEVLKAFLWLDGKPFNYDLMNQPRSQDLPVMHAFHPGITLIDREMIAQVRNVVGLRPKQFALKRYEASDVDYMLDFFVAEKLYEEIVLRGRRDTYD